MPRPFRLPLPPPPSLQAHVHHPGPQGRPGRKAGGNRLPQVPVCEADVRRDPTARERRRAEAAARAAQNRAALGMGTRAHAWSSAGPHPSDASLTNRAVSFPDQEKGRQTHRHAPLPSV